MSRLHLRPALLAMLVLTSCGDGDEGQGPVDEGALARVCFPEGWNGDLIVSRT